ncbi:replication factor C large subunit [Candidatus Bathyarchaeota archaeon]|nr:replication factor C large subunit [Candidatus Bathyarchaeota archaeon]
MSKVMWVEKYRPKSVSEIIGNEKAKSQFLNWLKNWEIGTKPVLLYGPPGVGKTTLVRVAAKEFGYSIIEMNASDFRTEEKVMRIAGRAATECSLDSFLTNVKGSLVFMDEIDGIFGKEDEGGVSAILRLSKEARAPVVLVANNPWDPKLRYLRGFCQMIRFYGIRTPTLVSFLARICRAEGIVAEEAALRSIAEKVEGDVRSAVNDLQALAEGRKVLRLADVKPLATRDRQYNVFDTLKALFSAKTYLEAEKVLRSSEIDSDLLLQTIHDNLPIHYTKLEELAEAYNALSLADIFFGRVSRTQNWGLLSYGLGQMTAGVALARKGEYHYAQYRFPPSKLTFMSQTTVERKLRDRLCARIGSKCHVSRRVANTDMLPFIRFIFENNRTLASKIAHWLNLEEDLAEYLSKK